MKFILLIFVTCTFIINTTAVMSHHGRFDFRYDISITLEGEVVDFQWKNPHIYMDLQITNDNNETVVWLIEGGTPVRLKRQGWEKDSIKVGDHVKIVGNPNRDPEIKHLYLDHVVRDNGKTLSLSSTIRRIETSEFDTTSADRKHPLRREANIPASDPTVMPSRDFSGTWSRGPIMRRNEVLDAVIIQY